MKKCVHNASSQKKRVTTQKYSIIELYPLYRHYIGYCQIISSQSDTNIIKELLAKYKVHKLHEKLELKILQYLVISRVIKKFYIYCPLGKTTKSGEQIVVK